MLELFDPVVRQWFVSRFGQASPVQQAGWPPIAAGEDKLIAAPTGSGKTLAAFLWSLDGLLRDAREGQLEDTTRVVYVSPLKALGNDIQKNLQEPLAQLQELLPEAGQIRTAVRTGDTPMRERARMARRPPHILITTPESLYILLTAESSRRMLRSVRTVIVDEIHAIAADKRGAHLALSLSRLEALVEGHLQYVGLSATQKPIETVARLLVGEARAERCRIVDIGHARPLELHIEVPDMELGPIATHEMWAEVYDRLVKQIEQHRTTLIFVNTRRLVERVAHQLASRLGESRVAAHHGSLSRARRLKAEQQLKSGEVSVVVATASLELGIDIGHVELVCILGSPRAIATLLQRVGRSGHALAGTPKGILYPLTRDDLVQSVAAVRAVRQGDLDRVHPVEKPLDVLAQQMVAAVASVTLRDRKEPEAEPSGGMSVEDLWALVTRAWSYRTLMRDEFVHVLEMLAEGIATSRGRRSAWLHWDRVHDQLWSRRGARTAAITNGGAIPDTADYDVVQLPDETFVGKINEDFAIESMAGDVFLLGNTSWRIARVMSGRVLVEDAQGQPPTIPFWLGEAPARTEELSVAVSELRQEVADRGDAMQWLEAYVPRAGAEQIVAYIRETVAALGVVPTLECVVAERFFDESGGMQLVLHSPFGARINRAWGLALRKRFCVTFDFELQAAATDDGIVISLSDRHSFPLENVFGYVREKKLDADLL
ncbi:MAG: DEAD/DEAH box helicase, partial [Candidatus Xenobia bacterium]